MFGCLEGPKGSDMYEVYNGARHSSLYKNGEKISRLKPASGAMKIVIKAYRGASSLSVGKAFEKMMRIPPMS
jgi:hypothetical protein